MPEKKYSPGTHPNSLGNLNYRGGRPKSFGSKKKQRTLTVTEEGWEGLQLLIEKADCKSVSDLLEKLGRGLVEIKIPA